MNGPEFSTIGRAFTDLADTLAGDFDILAFLDTLTGYCADLLPIAGCGALLSGSPALVAASTEHARALMTLELRGASGPASESMSCADTVLCPDLGTASGQWPALVPAALEYGLHAADGLPMRLRDQTIGALTLYRTETGTLDGGAAELAQSIADVATIGIVHQRTLHRTQVLTQQLQTALDSRVVIEQAKGRIAERLGVAVDEAFLALRRYARNNNMKLTDAARAVADGALEIDPTLSVSITRRPCGLTCAASARPPCAAAISAAMASPRPEPGRAAWAPAR
jgi:hypothetical protein